MQGLSPATLAALVDAALGAPLPPDAHLAVAVSGGPDSMGLLVLAAAAFPGRVTALTVDHRLRAGSAAEAATVAGQCAGLGIPQRILAGPGPQPRTNLHAAARAARYALLREACLEAGIGVLLTAHHAEDQAETLLLRLARGSGSAGLAGIRARRQLAPGLVLLRPLLAAPRAALAAAANAAGLVPVQDPSNSDQRFDRSRMRALLSREEAMLPAEGIAAAAAHLADVEAALDWAAERAWEGRALMENGVRLDAGGLPFELQRRLVARAVAAAAPLEAPVLRGGDVARLVRQLLQGRPGTLAGVKARPVSEGRLGAGRLWHFSPAPPRR